MCSSCDQGVGVDATREGVGVIGTSVGVTVSWLVATGVSVAGKGGAVNNFSNASIPAWLTTNKFPASKRT
jgi:hypothetical protein